MEAELSPIILARLTWSRHAIGRLRERFDLEPQDFICLSNPALRIYACEDSHAYIAEVLLGCQSVKLVLRKEKSTDHHLAFAVVTAMQPIVDQGDLFGPLN